jgi:hypothetical protein
MVFETRIKGMCGPSSYDLPRSDGKSAPFPFTFYCAYKPFPNSVEQKKNE